jgi:hypothetical protein
MLKKKVTKFTGGKLHVMARKTLVCQECNIVTVTVASDIGAVTCAYCVQRQVAPPAGIKPKAEGEKFPRGWALKQRYVHTDGRVFIKGKDTGEVVTPEAPKPKKEKKVTTKKKAAKKKSPKRRK